MIKRESVCQQSVDYHLSLHIQLRTATYYIYCSDFETIPSQARVELRI